MPGTYWKVTIWTITPPPFSPPPPPPSPPPPPPPPFPSLPPPPPPLPPPPPILPVIYIYILIFHTFPQTNLFQAMVLL